MIKFEPTSYVVARRLEGDIECIAHCAGQKAAKASVLQGLAGVAERHGVGQASLSSYTDFSG